MARDGDLSEQQLNIAVNEIVDHLLQNGCFQATSDVTKVSGIGSGIYEQIRDLVTANGCS